MIFYLFSLWQDLPDMTSVYGVIWLCHVHIYITTQLNVNLLSSHIPDINGAHNSPGAVSLLASKIGQILIPWI